MSFSLQSATNDVWSPHSVMYSPFSGMLLFFVVFLGSGISNEMERMVLKCKTMEQEKTKPSQDKKSQGKCIYKSDMKLRKFINPYNPKDILITYHHSGRISVLQPSESGSCEISTSRIRIRGRTSADLTGKLGKTDEYK